MRRPLRRRLFHRGAHLVPVPSHSANATFATLTFSCSARNAPIDFAPDNGPTGPVLVQQKVHDGTGCSAPTGTHIPSVARSGSVFAYGTAHFFGGRPALGAGESVRTMSATPNGGGYWLFTNEGRAFPFGNAQAFGDMTGVALNGPIVASVATASGKGYWLVASDGGVFAFAAPFRGSMGGTKLNRPVDGLVAFGNGYLMTASDGGIFDFSNKAFYGSLADSPPSSPIIGLAGFSS